MAILDRNFIGQACLRTPNVSVAVVLHARFEGPQGLHYILSQFGHRLQLVLPPDLLALLVLLVLHDLVLVRLHLGG